MIQTEEIRIQAEQLGVEAQRLHSVDRRKEALIVQRRSALLYASAMHEEESPSEESWRVRAVACRRLADYLTEAEHYPEAVTYYQEATDCCAQLSTEEGEIAARECAQKILQVVGLLRSRPDERLYLLTARYERLQQELALRQGTELAQAECSAHIARIFQRRDRPHEALAHYREALRLCALAEATPEVMLATAEAHHRIAGLYAYALDEPDDAARHYREAIALYTDYEPFAHGEQAARALCVQALTMLSNEQD